MGNTSPFVPLKVQENLTPSIGVASTSQRSLTVSSSSATTLLYSKPTLHLGASDYERKKIIR